MHHRRLIRSLADVPSVIPNILCHSRRVQSPSIIPDVGNRLSVMPDIGNRPAVIPDVFNRESKAFPRQGHTNEGTEEKHWIPAKTRRE